MQKQVHFEQAESEKLELQPVQQPGSDQQHQLLLPGQQHPAHPQAAVFETAHPIIEFKVNN